MRHTSIVGVSQELTVLDAEGSNGVIRMDNCNSEISNLTIKGGNLNSVFFGGSTNYPAVTSSLNWVGSGIKMTFSNPTLTNVTISYNKAEHGGGMYSFESNPVLTNVIIKHKIHGVSSDFRY